MMVLVLLFALTGSASDDNLPPRPIIGTRVADFSLPDIDKKQHALSQYKDKKAVVVVFVGTECPIANNYIPTLVELHKQYAGKGIQFLTINSNAQDSFDDVVTHARERHLPFPMLKDADQKVADLLGARRTPEAFLLDSKRAIRYRGRIDDQFGYTYRRVVPTRTELKDAIEAILAGKPIATPETEVRGCLIGRGKN